MRAFEMLELTPHYVATFINLPTGYVGIHVPSLDAAVNVSPDMQFVMQVQFDNISRDVGFSARYRWEYSPGDELFATLAQSAEIPGSHLVAETTHLSVRLGHTLRF